VAQTSFRSNACVQKLFLLHMQMLGNDDKPIIRALTSSQACATHSMQS
jgi:hypothetical protein